MNRGFWQVYDGLDESEVRARAVGFCVHWRDRVRTVNLAESSLRHFRRFFSRFPASNDEADLYRALGLYPTGSEPDQWRTIDRRLVN